MKGKWWIALFLAILILIPLIIFTFGKLAVNTPSPSTQVSIPTPFQLVISPSAKQQPFKIIAVSPPDGTQHVTPGEITVSFTTDVPIVSQNSFSLQISPPLKNYWKILNNYPTNEVRAQIVGVLTTNTLYTVFVKNSEGLMLSQWSFTTDTKPAENSSQLTVDQDEEINKKYYPLTYKIPYSTEDFTINYYDDRLKLHVTVKNTDLPKVKQEVTDWIKQNGVDPSTHTINFVTQ